MNIIDDLARASRKPASPAEPQPARLPLDASSPRSNPREPVRGLLLRMLIPVLVLGGLLALLGVIYRGSMPAIPKPVEVKPAPKPVVAKIPTYESLKAQYMEMTAGGVKTLQGFKPSKYRGGVAAVEKELNVFQSWAIFLDEADRYPLSPDERKTVASLARGFSALQRREFPAMRAEWARGLKTSLSGFKVIATTSGDRSQFLHVICPPQSGGEGMNRTAIELQGETAARLRFARIQFTFTDGFTLTAPIKPTKEAPPPDSQLVVWREKSFQPATWEPQPAALETAEK